MLRPRPLAALAALVLALSLAACGEKDEPDLSASTATTTTETGVAGFEILGSWSGQLEQANLKPFTVTVTIGSLEDPAANNVSYSAPIACTGNWTYLGQEGTAYRFREVITGGKGGNCKGKGIVTINPFQANAVDYDFQGGGVQSAGILKRAGT